MKGKMIKAFRGEKSNTSVQIWQNWNDLTGETYISAKIYASYFSKGQWKHKTTLYVSELKSVVDPLLKAIEYMELFEAAVKEGQHPEEVNAKLEADLPIVGDDVAL